VLESKNERSVYLALEEWEEEVDEDEDSDDAMQGEPPDAMYSQVLGDVGRAISGSPSPYATLYHHIHMHFTTRHRKATLLCLSLLSAICCILSAVRRERERGRRKET
jgi:hypothetical protein